MSSLLFGPAGMTIWKYMLFKRRHPQPFLKKVRNFIWPEMGLWRAAKYLYKRIIRISDTTYSIAFGLAAGSAISFTPAFGTHAIQAIALSWLFRGNWIASFVGTAIGNPYTFPFMWWLSGVVGFSSLSALGMGEFFADLPNPLTVQVMLDNPLKVYLPTLFGGYILAIISFPLFFYPYYYMVKGARAARRARLKRKAHKAAKQVTGQKD